MAIQNITGTITVNPTNVVFNITAPGALRQYCKGRLTSATGEFVYTPECYGSGILSLDVPRHFIGPVKIELLNYNVDVGGPGQQIATKTTTFYTSLPSAIHVGTLSGKRGGIKIDKISLPERTSWSKSVDNISNGIYFVRFKTHAIANGGPGSTSAPAVISERIIILDGNPTFFAFDSTFRRPEIEPNPQVSGLIYDIDPNTKNADLRTCYSNMNSKSQFKDGYFANDLNEWNDCSFQLFELDPGLLDLPYPNVDIEKYYRKN